MAGRGLAWELLRRQQEQEKYMGFDIAQTWKQHGPGDETVITVPSALVIGTHGLSVAEGSRLTKDQAAEATASLSAAMKAILYWVGDFAELLEGLFHEEASQFLDAEHFDEQTLAAARFVAKNVPLANREIAQSWPHAKAVAHLKPPVQAKLLQLSLDEDWSPAKLATEAKKAAAGGDDSALRFLLVVDCQTEKKQGEVKAALEKDGYAVTARTSVRKAPKAAKPKREKKGEVTAQKKRRGAPKMYTRKRPPQ